MKYLGQFLLLLFACSWSFTSLAQISTTNLLLNPGAEAGSITNWIVGGVSNPNVDNGDFDSGINPHSGTYDFYGGNGSLGTLSQTVGLVGAAGITTNVIDCGGLLASFSFWEQGLNQGSSSDHAAINLNFLDASSNSIFQITTPIVDSHNLAWENYTNSYLVPIGTRYIDYTMEFIRSDGSDNDSFIDDNVLSFIPVVVPDTTPPSLVIRKNASTAVLFWLASANGYILETSPSLSQPSWSQVSASPVTIASDLVVGVPMTGAAFYRLRHPGLRGP